MNNKKIAIFSGSSVGDNKYIEVSEKLGKEIALNRHTVVNGGGPGLMDIVAKAAFEEGGEVVGIHFATESRESSKYNTTTESFTELRPRQDRIIELADCFVVLPGGLGTIYEFYEVLAKKFLGEIDNKKPIIMIGKEFWSSMEKMMEMQINSGFMKKEMLEKFTVVDSVEEVMKEIKEKLIEPKETRINFEHQIKLK